MAHFPQSCAFSSWQHKRAYCWGARRKSVMPLIGVNILGISPKTGRGIVIFILIGFGPMRISISSASTITCHCQIGAKARPIWMRIGRAFISSNICNPISLAAKGMTGSIIRHKRLMHRSGHRFWIKNTTNLGFGGTKTFAAGGKTRITNGFQASGAKRLRRGCRDRNQSGLPNTDVQRSIKARMNPTNFWTPNRPRVSFRNIRTGDEMI